MANISAATDEKVFRVREWHGLNESPDGDTKLKLGEAAVMRNFKITRDKNLQRRPGLKQIMGLCNKYYTETEQTAKVVRVDQIGKLTMYRVASLKPSQGSLEINTETAAIVTYENQKDYVGYCWPYNDKIYDFVSCSYDAASQSYSWWMKETRAAPYDAYDTNVLGLWTGIVGDNPEGMYAVCDGKLVMVRYLQFSSDPQLNRYHKYVLGDVPTKNPVFMFGYAKKLYLMTGDKYMEYDGETVKEVEGYRPLVLVSTVPTGGGTALEQVNKLTGKRRAWYSPDGSAVEFLIAEGGLASVDYVKDLVSGTTMPTSSYTVDTAKRTVKFSTPPERGVNTIEIGWTNKTSFRESVAQMKFCEIFNGATDNRVFLYGDRSNKAFYSGLDYNGNPRADYFPDMNVLKVGEENTPITAMIRHYSRLIVFKSTSVYAVQYGVSTLADGTTTAMFYSTPINRALGNGAPGQVRLVGNSPRALFGRDLYEWRNNASYSSNLSVDERQAKRISDRITASLGEFDLSECLCWDDNDSQEYYICCRDKALVHNYAADAWYLYTDFPVRCMTNYRGQLFCGDANGRLSSVSYANRTDHGEVIRSYWESGSEAFDREFMRKYSAMLWLGIKPELHGEVTVTVQTDRKSRYTEKVVSSSLATFEQADFRKWSFNTNRKPHMTRSKIKAKKFVYYKLILESESASTTATILNADIRVRYTGYAK